MSLGKPERGVARLRVGDVPVAGRDLRQQREDGVAEVAVTRDQLPGLPGDQPVRLRVVDLAAGDRGDERLEIVRVHLVVRRHHTGDVDPFLQRTPVAGDDRRADPLVPLVDEDGDSRVAGCRRVRALAGGVA
jgi:hypothetical protein